MCKKWAKAFYKPRLSVLYKIFKESNFLPAKTGKTGPKRVEIAGFPPIPPVFGIFYVMSIASPKLKKR